MTVVDKPHHRKAQSALSRVLLPIVLVLVGLTVMLYPVIASQWNNYQQQLIAQKYENEIQEVPVDTLSQAVKDARAYNESHTDGPILDPWLARVSDDNEGYKEYLNQLSGNSAMSQVVIPAIDSKLPMYHGTDAATLQKGLGHLYGSALPVGGDGMHTVITGHTGITNATLWDNLVEVKNGDAIYISTFGEKMKYEVHDIEVVLPDETDSLAAVPGEDLITLITCTPYGINTHRLLVHAHRVPMDPTEAEVFNESGLKFQWWMWAVLAGAVLIMILMALWIRNMMRKAAGEANGSHEEKDK